MRVRYIFRQNYECFEWIGSIPAMRVRYIFLAGADMPAALGFNSRYAGKIHLDPDADSLTDDGSIPAMRVRYISKNNGKHCH